MSAKVSIKSGAPGETLNGERSPLAVFEESSSTLPSQMPCRDHAAKERRGAVLVVTEAAVEHLEDRQADVEADEVGQRERPHRMRHPELHDRVDRFRLRHTFHH